MNRLLRATPIYMIGALVAAAASGCGNTGGTFQMPEQSSVVAPFVDWVYYYIFWLCVFYFIHIMGMMGWFMWKYRRRPGHETQPSPHHNLPLEIAWTLPPVVLVITMFYYGFTGYVDMSTPPADAYKIEVRAKKWDWAFTYPNGGTDTILHVPPDQPVQVLMGSSDVLHSFFLPRMRVKKDVVPGRTSTAWWQISKTWLDQRLESLSDAEKQADYIVDTLYCTEYCGTNHSTMRAPVRIYKTRAAFEAAVKELNKETPFKLYQLNCASCHTYDGTAMVGPTFKGIYESQRQVYDPANGETKTITADEAYLRESILYAGKLLSRVGKEYDNQMAAQNFGNKLKPKQVDMLIEFLKDPEGHAAGKYDEAEKK